MMQKQLNTTHRLTGFIAAATAACGILFADTAYAETVLLGVTHIGPDEPSFLYQIDPSTGKATEIGTGIGFERISGMDFDPSTGTLYATGEKADGSDRVILITIDPNTGVVPVPDTWYQFKVEVTDTGTRNEIRAKVWPAGTAEPSDWQVDCWDGSSNRFTAGTVGIWSWPPGEKYWDDLQVISNP